eukprot:TRINITY_DN7194_c0_g2_i1.p1 TRINITY_DN7194_c0_g2~~TRINITY_DN7194_c0_g2_i1.p1  ORF type:complete len:164 (+),score=39.20 TRINITY_DN7194_c0_g2_i1:63-494(+)
MDPIIKFNGDNDPLDALEIGTVKLPTGSISSVKVIGALPMIDCGECDWKVIVINLSDPMADEIDCISDLEKFQPYTISGIREWFRYCKVPDGKGLMQFANDGIPLDCDDTLEVIQRNHSDWKALIDGEFDDLMKGKLWLPHDV